ncbi:MAG: hypothetical protein H0V70_29225 [Ktedonobacteraceae bacterium]|nr:hypothetical protein [Ktedonobacteraceae bacterium]
MGRKKRQKCSALPQVLIGPHDLKAIDEILTAYVAYLRNHEYLLPHMGKKIQAFEDLRTRIVSLRRGGEGGETLLSLDDLEAMRQALFAFVQIIRRIVPPSPERDATLKSVNGLRQHLEQGFSSK